MIIPEFDIRQIVYIYSQGMVEERIISGIRITIKPDCEKCEYQFEDDRFGLVMFDFWYSEKEIFKSKEALIKIISQ